MMNRIRLVVCALLVALMSIAASGKYHESRVSTDYSVTTVVGASETAWVRDTTPEFSIAGWDTWQFRLTIVGDTATPKGIGVKDSARVCLLTLRDENTWSRVDSSAGHIPFTWAKTFPADTVANKFGTKCRYEVVQFDTLGDTIATINYVLTEWRYAK
jgi:hypothetical protein